MEKPGSEKKLLSKSRAAKYLGIGKEKLNRLTEDGRIGFIQVYKRRMYPISALEEFINSKTFLERKIDDIVKRTIYYDEGPNKKDPFHSELILQRIIKEKSNGKYI